MIIGYDEIMNIIIIYGDDLEIITQINEITEYNIQIIAIQEQQGNDRAQNDGTFQVLEK